MKKYYAKFLIIDFIRSLYLCDIDINVGDEIHIIENSKSDKVFDKFIVDYYKESLDAYRRPNGGFVGKRISINVIGLISEDCKWVKDGDTFDFNQISISRSCEKFDECDLLFGEQTCSAPHAILNPIKIKCPCCDTFK